MKVNQCQHHWASSHDDQHDDHDHDTDNDDADDDHDDHNDHDHDHDDDGHDDDDYDENGKWAPGEPYLMMAIMIIMIMITTMMMKGWKHQVSLVRAKKCSGLVKLCQRLLGIIFIIFLSFNLI